jgi:Protein of unknown function (DUF3309)
MGTPHQACASPQLRCSALKARLTRKKVYAMLHAILFVLLILLLVGAFPTWPYSSGWGYGPSGVLGTVLIVLVVLLVMGRI